MQRTMGDDGDRLEDAVFDWSEGVYDATRAAALSGVPRSTLHYWARKEIYVPSVASEPRTRLWSWGDLLAVRAISWFRSRKGPDAPPPIRMQQVRAMLAALESSGISRDQLYGLVAVTDGGQLTIRLTAQDAIVADAGRQTLLLDVLHLVQPFGHGPDLFRPRQLLRIVPGKLHGEPHLVDTRIASAVIFEFARMGYSLDTTAELYPDADPAALQQAIEFEQDLLVAA